MHKKIKTQIYVHFYFVKCTTRKVQKTTNAKQVFLLVVFFREGSDAMEAFAQH